MMVWRSSPSSESPESEAEETAGAEEWPTAEAEEGLTAEADAGEGTAFSFFSSLLSLNAHTAAAAPARKDARDQSRGGRRREREGERRKKVFEVERFCFGG